MQDLDPQSREDESVTNPRTKNMKNVYIRKLSQMKISRQSLHEIAGHDQQDKKTRRVASYCTVKSNHQQKLSKNRESARRARIRKRIYVQLLEKQVARLKEMAAEGKTLEKDSQNYLSQLRMHVSERRELSNLKPVLLDNMFNVTSCVHKISPENVNSLLTSYQNKLGPACKERFDLLDKQVSELQDCFVPHHLERILQQEEEQKRPVGQQFSSNGTTLAAGISLSGSTINSQTAGMGLGLPRVSSANNNNNNNQIKIQIESSQPPHPILIKLKQEQEKLGELFTRLRGYVSDAKRGLQALNRIFDDMKSESSSLEACKLLQYIQNENNKKDVAERFINFLRGLELNKVKKNEQELYEFIFAEELRKSIFINVVDTEQLLRRMTIYLEKSTH